jgi:hypothetical protein
MHPNLIRNYWFLMFSYPNFFISLISVPEIAQPLNLTAQSKASNKRPFPNFINPFLYAT